MGTFHFEDLAHAPLSDLILLSDQYHEARVIDSPRDYFAKLTRIEQDEIVSFYRSGRFLKVLRDGVPVGFLGHGGKPGGEFVVIFYLFLPPFRGKGLFKSTIDAFALWCLEKYPDRKFLRANSEPLNVASIRALKRSGFLFLEECLMGPDEKNRVPFHCYIRKLRD